MQRLILTSCVLFVSLLAACDRRPAAQETSRGPTAPPADLLTQEATKIAADLLGQFFERRGDTWRTLTGETGEHLLNGLKGLEMKNVTTSVRAEPVTPADKLNGIEWKGVFVYRPIACRLYYPQTNRRPMGGWTEWHDGAKLWTQVIAQKNGGKWVRKFQIKDQTQYWEDQFLFFIPAKPQARALPE